MNPADFRETVHDALEPRLHRIWWHDPTTLALRPLIASSRIVPLLLVPRTDIHHGASARARPFYLKLDCRWSHRAGQSRKPFRKWGRDCQPGWCFPWNVIAEQAKRECVLLTGLSQACDERSP